MLILGFFSFLTLGGKYGLINRGFSAVERIGLGISRVFCALATLPPHACVPPTLPACRPTPCWSLTAECDQKIYFG